MWVPVERVGAGSRLARLLGKGERSRESSARLQASKHLLGKQLWISVIARWIFSCLGQYGSVIGSPFP